MRAILLAQHEARSIRGTTREKEMERIGPVVVEQSTDELPEQEPVELSTHELEKISGGMCDPGIIIHEK